MRWNTWLPRQSRQRSRHGLRHSRARSPVLGAVERLEERSLLSVEPITLADPSLFGLSADGHSEMPSISADGQLIAFASTAANLVPNDFNKASDIFLFNRGTGRVSLVSANSTNTGSALYGSAKPKISADGGFVLFESVASDLVPGVSGYQLYVRDLQLGTTLLVSARNGTTTVAGVGNSLDGSITPDGRFVVFESSANNLVDGDAYAGTDIFIRDLRTNTTQLVSLANDGAASNGLSYDPSVTPDGRFIVFASIGKLTGSNNTVNDDNGIEDVYVRDRVYNTTELVTADETNSFAANAHAGNLSHQPISDDGRYVVFYNAATNLVSENTIYQTNAFIRDLTENRTYLLSRSKAGTSGSNGAMPVITADGKYAAWVGGSNDTKSDVNDTNGQVDMFRSDLTNFNAIVTEMVSVNADRSNGGNNISGTNQYAYTFSPGEAVISRDGRYIAFVSEATNLVANVTDGNNSQANGVYHRDVFLRDMVEQKTTLVSVTPGGLISGDSGSYSPTMNDPALTGGNVVIAFESDATNIVPGDANRLHQDLHVRDLGTGVTEMISVHSPLLPDSRLAMAGGSLESISADGRYVAFLSAGGSSDLTPEIGTSIGWYNVFVRDTWTGKVTVESINPDGVTAIGSVSDPRLSADGRYLAFASNQALDPRFPAATARQVYVRDRAAGVTRLVTVKPDGTPAGTSDRPEVAFSADGRYVAFSSAATDLVTGFVDGNSANFGYYDIFIRDLHAGVTRLVSHTPGSATTSGNGFSRRPAFSPDGRKVAFVSYATNLEDGVSDANASLDLFVYDVATGAVNAASVIPDGSATGNQESSDSVSNPASRYIFSPDGRYLFFGSRASNLVTNDLNGVYIDVYRRDLQLRRTTLVSINLAGSSSIGHSFGPSISKDGRYVAFVSDANNLVSGDTGFRDVFVRDMDKGTTERVSVDAAGGQANNSADGVAWISPDGRRVAFGSIATDLVNGFVDGNAGGFDLYLRDLDAGHTVLVSANNSGTAGSNAEWSYGAANAMFSGDGHTLYLDGPASNLINGDRNGNTDVFAYHVSGAGKIAGTVFNDLDGSGTQNGAEAAIQFWTVYLDANGNNRFDSGETNVQTDASGNYSFLGLSAGTYTVGVHLADGITQTTPLEPPRHTIVLATDTSVVGAKNFGAVGAQVDLDVTGVFLPASGNVGGEVSVGWTVRNLGANAAAGSWQDAIYLSKDATLDGNDTLLATVPHEGGLAAGASYTNSAGVTIPSVSPGNYYVFVRTDRRNQVTADVNDENNLATTFEPIALTIPSLTIGSNLADSFTGPNQTRYYQVTVPAGQSLALKLDSAAADGQTELYVRFADLPTTSAFDVAARVTQADQRLVVPTTQPGTYYILARSRFGIAATSGFTLTAALPSVTLTSVGPGLGGNTGKVTVELRGTNFTASTTAQLNRGATTLAAASIDFRDASQMFATFDLTGRAVGSYDVKIIDGSSTATLSAAFQVVAGVSNPVQVSLTVPRNIRAGRTGTAIVEYVNTGNTDAVAPLLRLTADKARLRLEDDLEFGDGTLDFLGISTTGPAGVLRPGERGQLRIPFLHTGPANVDINFQVITLASTTAVMDWAGIKTAFRPGHIGVDAWDAVFANFLLEAGTTTGDYQAMLARAASYLSSLGVATPNVTRLLTFELAKADAVFTASSLARVEDASFPTPGSDLMFVRTHQQAIHGRYATSAFGRGWTHNWDIQATTLASGDVVLRIGGGRRFFAMQADGSYRGGFGDCGSLVLTGGAYTLTETDSTVVAFRPDGKLDFIEEDNGNRVTAGYDGSNRLTSLTHSSGPVISLTYNAQGLIDRLTDPAGRTVAYVYDASGEHLTGYTDKYGTHTYTYVTGQGQAREHALESINFSDDTHIQFTYDPRGRLIKENRDGNSVPVTYSYLPGGGHTITDGTAGTNTILYDDRGQVRRAIDPLGRIAEYSYDHDFNLTAAELPLGVRYAYQYDVRGNATRITDALGRTTDFTYDAHGNLLGFTDARNNTTRYGYDPEDNLLDITYANGTVERFDYDLAGNVEGRTNRRGRAIGYTYNHFGQVTRKTFADGSHVDYTYDTHGNLKTATVADGTITLTYTPLDVLDRITYPNERYLDFEYNIVGQRIQSVDQDGFKVDYLYDDLGRLEKLTGPGGALIVKYTFDAAGRVKKIDRGNGTTTVHDYDDAGQLLKITHFAPDGTTVNSSFEYTYDALGRRTTMKTADGTTSYGCDATGQLTSVNLPGGRTIEYEYDPAGNRTRVIDSLLGTTNYQTNELNQIIHAGNTSYSYDLDGNLASKSDATLSTAYTFNDENRLTGVSGPGMSASYDYNPLGMRDSETVNGQTTNFLIDPLGLWSIAAEYDGGGAAIAHYTYGMGLTSRVAASGAAGFYDFDATGNTAGVTDAAGAYVNRYSYLPFGETTTLSASLPNAFTFVGEFGVRNDSSGGFDMRFRNYDAGTGGFISVDPLGFAAGDTNFVRHVGNDPVNNVDPTGLCDDLKWSTPFLVVGSSLLFVGGLGILPAGIAGGVVGGIGVVLWVSGGDPANAGTGTGNGGNAGPAGSAGGAVPGCSCGCPPGSTPEWPGDGGPEDNVTPNDSFDPNDIIGPSGFGAKGWINPEQDMPYTIHFENKSVATAAAQEVFVTHQLDADLDWTTFELGDFGWGAITVDVPDGLSAYTTQVATTNLDGSPLVVSVSASVNAATGLVTWEMRSVDPATGELPEGVMEGFLPPNDGTHRGEGFVTYMIKPKSGLVTGGSVDQQASIIFDVNDPVLTNVFTNTIDARLPTSTVSPLPAVTTTPSFTVSWSGSDDADGTAGSDIAGYDIFVSENGGPFEIWLAATTDTTADYPGAEDRSYAFYSVATDNVGHSETAPANPDATTTVQVLASTLSISTSSATKLEGNSSTTPFTFTVTRTGNTSGATSVNFSVTVTGSGANPANTADFGGTLPSGTVNFNGGDVTQTITINVSGDTTVESDEGFTVMLSNATNGATIITPTATGTIQNDDAVVGTPDLVATRFDALSDHVVNGQTLVRLVIENQGDGPAGPFDVQVILSDDDVVGNADDVVVTTLNYAAGLDTGGLIDQTVDLQLVKSVLLNQALRDDAPGQGVGFRSTSIEFLALVIDPGNQIAEGNAGNTAETNNLDQGQGVDKDDVTYFPWDTNGSGAVTPTDAGFVINRLGQLVPPADRRADLNGNGAIQPTDAGAVINRIGYLRNDSVIEVVPQFAATNQTSAADGKNTLDGGLGYDPLNGDSGNDTLDGGTENDLMLGEDGINSLLGGIANDVIIDETSHDTRNGNDGNDTILGGTGADSRLGGSGIDLLIGEEANDTLSGQAGIDSLSGGAGSNTLVDVSNGTSVTSDDDVVGVFTFGISSLLGGLP